MNEVCVPQKIHFNLIFERIWLAIEYVSVYICVQLAVKSEPLNLYHHIRLADGHYNSFNIE